MRDPIEHQQFNKTKDIKHENKDDIRQDSLRGESGKAGRRKSKEKKING